MNARGTRRPGGPRVDQLRAAIVDMADRYANSHMREYAAYQAGDMKAAEIHGRAYLRQYKVLIRLSYALARLAEGTA